MNQELDQNQLSQAQIVNQGGKEQKKQDSCGIDKLGQVSHDQKDKKKKKKDKKKKKKSQSIEDEENNHQESVAQKHDESIQGDKIQQVKQTQPQLKNNSFPNSQLEHDQQQKQELTNQQGQVEGNTLTDAQKQQVGENLSNQEEKPELIQQLDKENIQEQNTQEPSKQTPEQKTEDNSTNLQLTQQPQNEEPTEQPLQVVEQETQQKPTQQDKKPQQIQQPTTQLPEVTTKSEQKKDSQVPPSKKKTSSKQVAGSKKSIKEKEQHAQLQLLLKDKLKQIKTLSNKNSKLQAKYIDLFKENKTIKKDSNTLIQSVISIVDMFNGNLEISYNDKKDLDNFTKHINELTSMVKNPSLVKEELVNKWKTVLEMKINIQLFKKDQIHNQTIQTIQKQHLEQIQKQTTQNQKSLQQLQINHQTETEKLTQKIISLQTELQTNKLKHEKQLNTISQLHSKTISQLKESLKQQLIKSSSYQLDQLSSIHEEQLKSLYDEIEKLRNKDKQSQETLKQMDEKLDAKNAEVSKLMKEKLKLEHQINQLKVKAIQEEFDETQNFERNQEQSINERNEFLKIRQELESMMEKRDQFKFQILKLQSELQNSKSLIKKKDSEIEELLNQLNLLRKERNQSFTNNHIEFKSKQLHQSRSTNGKDRNQLSSQIPQHIEIKSSEQLPAIEIPPIHPRKSSKTIEEKQALQQQREEYLRNVFIRYMKALLKGQSESCQTLLSVILKILKVPERDRAEVQQLLNSKRKWWIF